VVRNSFEEGRKNRDKLSQRKRESYKKARSTIYREFRVALSSINSHE
jgi:hypothetical protein